MLKAATRRRMARGQLEPGLDRPGEFRRERDTGGARPGRSAGQLRRDLYARGLATGEELWQLTADGGIVAVEVAGDTAYAGTSIETMSGRNGSGRVYMIQRW